VRGGYGDSRGAAAVAGALKQHVFSPSVPLLKPLQDPCSIVGGSRSGVRRHGREVALLFVRQPSTRRKTLAGAPPCTPVSTPTIALFYCFGASMVVRG
jgi:hypothetical protein